MHWVHRSLRVLLPGAFLLGFSFWGPDPEWDSIRAYINENHPGVESVTPMELTEMLVEAQESPVILDVREATEFEVSHLAGAIRVKSPSEIAARLRAEFSKGGARPIVAYCSVGVRSARLVEQLNADGFEDVFNLDGSIFSWANAGLPLVRGDEPTELVHPYNRSWGALLRPELWSWDASNADR